MIDRRNFLNVLTVSAAMAAVPAAAQPDRNPIQSRIRISLNGEWEQYREGKFLGTAIVPSSRRLSGIYTLNCSFALPLLSRGDRAFLHFEAVTYWAQVSVNGRKLGTFDPYVPHEFEFTQVARRGENALVDSDAA